MVKRPPNAGRLSRREWTVGALGLSAAEVASAWQHAHDAVSAATPPRFEALDTPLARDIEALAAQIIPSDGTPGAREAGVIYFIDRALHTWEADKLEAYRKGMYEVQLVRKELFPGSASVASLRADQAKGLVAMIEKMEFFE